LNFTARIDLLSARISDLEDSADFNVSLSEVEDRID
jgi:hypothetical protein